VSSTSMNVPNITEIAMIQGLTWGMDVSEFTFSGVPNVRCGKEHKDTKTRRHKERPRQRMFYRGLSLCLRVFVFLSFHSHLHHHRHSRAELVLGVLSLIQNQLYRHALDNLDVIPRSVFRRQQAELRARG